jgi:hypothetical protein
MFSSLCLPWQSSRRQSPAPARCIIIIIITITTNEIGPLTGAFFLSGYATRLFFEPLFGPCYKSETGMSQAIGGV